MRRSLSAALAATMLVTPVVAADIWFDESGLTGDFGDLQLRGRFTASLQGAAIDPVEPVNSGSKTDGAVDGSARLSLEYTTDNALIFGVAGEVDSGAEDIEGFERDELYVYAASEWGRIEIGENDGPADTLSFHAPQVGLGQVRGDFARYSGSVALLSPYDTQDAGKVTYLSPPVSGFRFGVAYTPEFAINSNDPVPQRRLIEENVVELGAQFVRPVGDWIAGASAAYVTGEADPVTGREDIESWGVGAELRRGKLTLGAAYVDRGRSGLFPASEPENEWNAGALWREEGWAVAGSVAISDENGGTISRYGIGAEYDITDNVYVSADAIFLEKENSVGVSREGVVGLLELGVRF